MTDESSTNIDTSSADNLKNRTPRSVSRRYQLSFFTVVAVLFVLARSWSAYPLVFPESGGTRLLGVDSYFHLRHAEYSAKHFPRMMRYDPGAQYPMIGKQQVTGLFNILIAATALVGSGFRATPDDVARAAAWAPLLISLLALWLLFQLGTFLGGFRAGAFSILVFTLYPGSSISRGMLGFADQHAAEMLFALASIAGLVYCLEKTQRQSGLSWKKPAMVHALPFAAFFYVWLGTPIYIAIMAISLFALILQQFLITDDTHRLAVGLFRFFIAAAIWQLAIILLWPDLLMELITGMRWWNLGAMTAFAVVPAAFLAVARKSISLGLSRWLFTLIAVVAASILVYLFFEHVPNGKTFSGWLLRPRSQDISEQRLISIKDLWDLFGTAGVFAALSILASLLIRNSSTNARWSTLAVTFGATITYIWLRTHDFDYVPPVFIALMAGLFISFFLDWSGHAIQHLKPNPVSRHLPKLTSLLPTGFALALVLPIWPLQLTDLPYRSTQQIKALRLQSDAWYNAMTWMRSETPEPTLLPKTEIVPPIPGILPVGAYGVMTAWDYGNYVATIGHRLPVSSRFPSTRSAKWLTAVSEQEGDSLLCQGCVAPENVRYVIIDARLASRLFLAKARAAGRSANIKILGTWNADGVQVPQVSYGPMFEDAMSTRLFVKDGQNLGGYRHIYESTEVELIAQRFVPKGNRSGFWAIPIESSEDLRQAVRITQRDLTPVEDFYLYNARIVPKLKIFQVVAGAHLKGVVAPGDTVSAHLSLRSTVSEREFAYSNSTVADSSGHFDLRLPYSTEESENSGTTTVSVGKYNILIAGRSTSIEELSVTENAVISGSELRFNR